MAADPQKILMIAPTSFFSDYGCSVRIYEETRAIQNLGHSVTICTYKNGQDLANFSIRRTLSIPFREHYEVGSSLHKVAFDFLLFWTALSTAIRHRPDIIHAHMHEGALVGLVIGRLLRIPMVFDFQGSMTSEMLDHGFLSQDGVFFRPLRWMEERIDRLSPIVLTSSQNAEQLLVSEYGCQPERVINLADCVDGETFYPATESERANIAQRRTALGIPAGRQVVVYLGLLATYQGTDALLQAAAQVLEQRDDIHFLIMGFPAVAHYKHLARELGVAEHTTFTGKVAYRRARDSLALGDVAVAPKMSATEGSGKILNYMATGLPTVVFDTPVSREYLGEEGIYASPNESGPLADALLRTLDADPETRQAHGARLRARALGRFSWQGTAETILRAYKMACQR